MRNRAIQLGLVAAAILMANAGSADAVVYCKYVGVPQGCIVRPGVVLRPAPAVAVRPVPAAAAVRVAPGVGAPGVGVRRGVGVNRGGPVNRVGRR